MTLIAGALLANTAQELSITTVVIAGAAGADRAPAMAVAAIVRQARDISRCR
jgi:hypothetical protein